MNIVSNAVFKLSVPGQNYFFSSRYGRNDLAASVHGLPTGSSGSVADKSQLAINSLSRTALTIDESIPLSTSSVRLVAFAAKELQRRGSCGE